MSWRLGLLAVVVSLAEARPAHACAGPCQTPEFRSVRVFDESPLILANFGFLRLTPQGWHLTCEEAVGGLLLDVALSKAGSHASTSNGLYSTSNDLCEWFPNEAGLANDWTLGFGTVPASERGDDVRFALVIDRLSQEVLVQRSSDGAAFETVTRFEPGSGYDTLIAGEGAVIVMGYTFNPRTWQVSASTDGGDTWAALPGFEPNAGATFEALAPLTKDATKLWVHSSTSSDASDELWVLDVAAQAIERTVRLPAARKLVGLTEGDGIVLAARKGREGFIYALDADSGELTEVSHDTFAYSGLTSRGNELFVTVDDFTRDSPFLVARSSDRGETWEPLMTLDDLAGISSCGAVCNPTTAWLNLTYGVAKSAADAGATPSRTNDEGSVARNTRSTNESCSLRASGERVAATTPPVLLLLFATLFLRRRRAPRS